MKATAKKKPAAKQTAAEERGHPVLVGQVSSGKAARTTIQVRILTFDDRRYIDVRRFYKTTGGELAPTTRGLAVTPELAQKIVALMLKAAKVPR